MTTPIDPALTGDVSVAVEATAAPNPLAVDRAAVSEERSCPLASMLTYSLGECANSLVMNGIFGFAMLFYTKALGLDPKWAGLAMSVSVFWEAISEPVMGHISDNTRSRWGRRHPYMLIGGLLMSLCSYFIWSVPDAMRISQVGIFWYLVTMNLLLRTGLTMFFIPYMALGFEICTDYQGRSRLQGLRSIFNMAANFAGPAMAWTLFFRDETGVQATTVAGNYLHMGTVFAAVTAIFVLVVVVATYDWREDTRRMPRRADRGSVGSFFLDMKLILLDPFPRWVFVFIFVVCAGMVLVSSLQMYVYDDFMRFPAGQKSIAHGSTMIGFAIGAALSVGLSRMLDKKGAVLVGGLISVVCNAMLAVLFLTGWVPCDAIWQVGSASIPLALVLFVIFHAAYWMGNGILLPISNAMMADVSEIHLIKTGENKDGGYSSVFSLAMRMAISFSLIVSGYCLSAVGYHVPQGNETVATSPDAIWRVGLLTFVVGAIIAAAALGAIVFYPVNRKVIESLRVKAKICLLVLILLVVRWTPSAAAAEPRVPASDRDSTPGTSSIATKVVRTLDDCNVIWNSPSKDSFGSMPLGNGDIGANVWVESDGDLLFYVSKVDAFDSNHGLPKLGRVRIRFTPVLDSRQFRQSLILRSGVITIHAGDVDLRVWIDANNPVVRVTGYSAVARTISASFETLRPCSEQLDSQNRLAWAYRNTGSMWANHFKAQNTSEFVAANAGKDPILNRTSGCRLWGKGFIRDDKRSLKANSIRDIDLSVRVLSSQTATLREWFADLEKPVVSNWEGHCAWWNDFWNRSRIFVSRCGNAPVNLDQCRFSQFPLGSIAYKDQKLVPAEVNAFQISQRYALERFCEAAAGRGAVPPPFNGSIFLMDWPAGAKSNSKPLNKGATADSRPWGNLPFMWQNTRHPYWAMATRGDYDTLLPGMKFVRDGLEICRDRCRKAFNHDGAFINEASLWYNLCVWDFPNGPGHLRYHYLATLEIPAMMCEYYEHTRDRKFLVEVLLPCADEFVRFYELHYPKRDARGRIVMEPAGTVETYQGVTNPNTETTALRFVLGKLLSFEIDDARRANWTRLLGILPDVPLRRIKGMDLLAVGERYDPGRTNCESPEMYSVYPFRQIWLGTPERLAMGRQSYHVRTISLDGTVDSQSVETGGWQLAPVQAAYLGLPREAARLASINFNDEFIDWYENPSMNVSLLNCIRPRFPAFWEFKMDATPDNDHGAVSANALQSMLLQSNGKAIYLLPAWPEDWDVTFKLHAAWNTTVECEYRDGRVQSLKVTPDSRRADVVDFSSLDNRIRTLVGVACADRNYLFGLPPMLDGQPAEGKTTAPWLAKYGESVTGVHGTPWPGCLFRDNVVHLHMLDGPVLPPAIDVKLVSSTWLTAKDEKPDAILKLQYDRPVGPLVMAASAKGSLTAGRPIEQGQVDLGAWPPSIMWNSLLICPLTAAGKGYRSNYRFRILMARGKRSTVGQYLEQSSASESIRSVPGWFV